MADEWNQGRVGLRANWLSGSNNALTFNLNHYSGDNGETLTIPINPLPAFGANTRTYNDEMSVSGSKCLD